MSMQFGGRRARSLPAVAGLVALVVVGGCKGKTQTKDSQETLDRLASLEAQLKDKDSYIQKLRDENAELQRTSAGTGAPGEWVFVIEGDALTIKGKPSSGGGGGDTPIDDATATAMSKQFLGMIDRSRGAIQKCYEQALKKSTGLQARTVTLTLNASFSASGAFSRVTFSPELPAGFDTCLRGVASKWKLPEAKAAMTFQASVKLTPT